MSALPARRDRTEDLRRHLVILRGDEMAELPTDAVNSRYRPLPDAHEQQLWGSLARGVEEYDRASKSKRQWTFEFK